jgi:ribosomal protein S18 acetylase RimI-like enzyme
VPGLLRIREASARDLDALVALDSLAQRSPGRAARLRAAIERGECFVAERGGVIAGHAVLEHSFYDNGFLALLLVREPDRRSGIGSALVREAERRCRSEKLFTSTNASNRLMQALLSRLGFARCGTIEELDPGDPEWVYVRRVGAEARSDASARGEGQ